MPSPHDFVEEFHKAFDVPIEGKPTLPAQDRRDMRIRILKEELQEYLAAEESDDLVEVADALADMVYVIYGTALEYGLPLDQIIEEVHRSNMSKLDDDGKPIHREDGKVVKSQNYTPPNIEDIIKSSRSQD